jgi:tetratricopeptide (TPR) repeat protein
VSAITTGDPAAIRAYLAGERFYRASEWDSAVAAFQRAVAADTAFALAHYKTARAILWTAGVNDEIARRSAGLAYRYGDRLPTRERTLVVAQELRFSGSEAEADDTLLSYLDRYPDDPEAWFVIVDNEYHRREEEDPLRDARTPPAERVRPFDRVLRLDPTYTPALVHPLGIALQGDSALIAQYVSALRAAAPGNRVAQEAYGAVAHAILNPGDVDALIRALALVLGLDTSSRDLAWQVRNASEAPVARLTLTLPAADQRALLEWLRRHVDENTRDVFLINLLGRLLGASGRLSDLWRTLELPEIQAIVSSGSTQRMTLVPSDLGYIDLDYYDRVGRGLTAGARLRVEILAAIDRADPDALRDVIERARARARETDAPIWEVRAQAAEGFLQALEGESVTGLARVDTALVHFSGQTEPFRFRWVDWMTRYPETRAQARQILELIWPGDPSYSVPSFYLLGRVLEAEGESAAAISSLRKFVEAVADADSGLLLQTRVDSARAALRRLGEG